MNKAAYVILHDTKELLTAKMYNGKWTLPGGQSDSSQDSLPLDTALREFREEIGIDIDDIDVEFEHVFGYEKYKVFSYRCSKNTLRNVVKNSSPQNGEIISVSTMKIKLFQDYVSKNEEERGWFSQPITALIDALRSDERTSYWQDKIWAKNNRNSDRERLGR